MSARSASRDGLPGPVTLKASRDGGKVAARWTALGPCRTGPRVALVNFTPATTVRASGAFGRSERFKVRYDNALVRYRVYFGGRISGESATGSLRLRARIYNRAGHPPADHLRHGQARLDAPGC